MHKRWPTVEGPPGPFGPLGFVRVDAETVGRIAAAIGKRMIASQPPAPAGGILKKASKRIQSMAFCAELEDLDEATRCGRIAHDLFTCARHGEVFVTIEVWARLCRAAEKEQTEK